MGAQAFTESIRAKKAGEGFDELFDRATYDHGHDPYNGTINTCDMGRCTLTLRGVNDENKVKAREHIESKDFGTKRVADWVQLISDEKGKDDLFIFYGWAAC